MDKKERMRALVKELSAAARAYYQESREIMTNEHYDKLYDELLALEKETGTVLAGSPTEKVGYEVLSELPKERHEKAALSLDKTKDRDALAAFLGDQEGVLSWKLDGLTIVLTYEGGRLQKAVTRGNGEIGEVVTQNAGTFVNLPAKIPFTGHLVLRGEAVIRYSDFERMNAEMDTGEKYKNPRNLCAGSVRQLDPSVTAGRCVNLVAFSLIEAEGADKGRSMAEDLDFLDTLGFETVERVTVTRETVKEAVADFAEQVTDYDIPSDGLVLVMDDLIYGEALGRTAKFPKNAIAFKWQDEMAETILREIEWSASRTGLINPVAIFDPVELEGTTVSRASAHNISIMEELRLGIGDRITVYKANMIIPQIAENLTRSGDLTIPERCPVCGEPTEVRNENGVKTLFCKNPDCPAKQVKSFSLFVSRNALNIDGLSEMTLEKFIDLGIVKSFKDLFTLEEKREQIVALEGFGEKSFENLLAAAEKARDVTPAALLYGLGIPGIGVRGGKMLADHFGNDLEALRAADTEALQQIEGVGEIMARDIYDYFRDEKQQKMLAELLPVLRLIRETAEEPKTLSGRTYVITGEVHTFKNRDELKAFIEARGGKVVGSVSKNTYALINNDVHSGSSKNQKAKELGIPIISEEDFLKDV